MNREVEVQAEGKVSIVLASERIAELEAELEDTKERLRRTVMAFNRLRADVEQAGKRSDELLEGWDD